MDWEPRVGMRVVCISKLSKAKAKRWGVSIPSPSLVYTIRDVFSEPRFRHGEQTYLRLVEIVNVPSETSIGPYEAGFSALHFRPLDERRLDIFRVVLTKAPTPEKEPA